MLTKLAQVRSGIHGNVLACVEEVVGKHLRRYKRVVHLPPRQSLILIFIIFDNQQTGPSYIIYNINPTQNLHEPS